MGLEDFFSRVKSGTKKVFIAGGVSAPLYCVANAVKVVSPTDALGRTEILRDLCGYVNTVSQFAMPTGPNMVTCASAALVTTGSYNYDSRWGDFAAITGAMLPIAAQYFESTSNSLSTLFAQNPHANESLRAMFTVAACYIAGKTVRLYTDYIKGVGRSLR